MISGFNIILFGGVKQADYSWSAFNTVPDWLGGENNTACPASDVQNTSYIRGCIHTDTRLVPAPTTWPTMITPGTACNAQGLNLSAQYPSVGSQDTAEKWVFSDSTKMISTNFYNAFDPTQNAQLELLVQLLVVLLRFGAINYQVTRRPVVSYQNIDADDARIVDVVIDDYDQGLINNWWGAAKTGRFGVIFPTYYDATGTIRHAFYGKPQFINFTQQRFFLLAAH